jgi:hypothetical protein
MQSPSLLHLCVHAPLASIVPRAQPQHLSAGSATLHILCLGLPLGQQVCEEVGWPCGDNLVAAHYLIGDVAETKDLLQSYPELVYYRDTVFLFKFMMSPLSQAFPKVQFWPRGKPAL